MKVVIVGAGPAGLAATYHLQQRGVDVTACEVAPAAGGRARGYVKDGYLIDAGAQFAAPFYTATIALMHALGRDDEFKPFHFKTAVWRNGKLYPLASGMHPLEQLRSLPDLVRFRGLSHATVFQALKMLPGLFRNYRKVDYANWDFSRLIDLDALSVAEYTLRHGGQEALEYLFQPLTAYMTLGEPEEVSMSHFLAILGFFVQGIWSLKHGMGQVCRSLYEACAQHVRLNTPVDRIVIEDNHVKGIEVNGALIEADAVICAVSSREALKLMPNLPEPMCKLLETVKYSQTCHITFGLEQRLMPEKWYSVVLPRTAGFLTTGPVESSGKSPYYAPPGGGLVHCLTYGTRAHELMQLPDDALKRLMIDDIRRVFPAFPENPPVAEIHRWDAAVCLQAPGQFPAIQRLKQTHAHDISGLCLAGDYMSLFSSVEAAVRSGLYAADQAIRK